ncbi:hypothetical protein LJC11_00925 [Bacteroidales bacterium OttesenSCG-928-I21]|nr:hypothetical protein [Bacteroidales bacterium OttesenSCG-928-I21]
MKKLKKLLLVFVVFAFIFNACAPEDPAEGVNIEQTVKSSATIEGVAYVNTNTSATTVQQFAPEGTLLIFTIDNSDYGVSSAGKVVKSTTVGAEGKYSVSVPARTDGQAVTVKINGSPILIDVTTPDKVEKQLFKLSEVSENVVKELTYVKKLEYAKDVNITETANWTEGTYKATLKYNNGKEDVAVPEGTEVKITIAGDQFIPERSNDLVFVEAVGANGMLEIKTMAPNLLEGGLTMDFESTFIADYITINSGIESTLKYTFELPLLSGILFGNEIVDDGVKLYNLGSSVETADILSTWINGTYKVKFIHDNDLFAVDNNFTSIPENARMTITEYRSIVDPSLSDVVKTMTYGQFSALNSGEGYVTIAPNPEISTDALILGIEVNFIATKKDSETPEGVGITNKYNYAYSGSSLVRGDIVTNGGTDFTQPDGSTVIKNAVDLEPFRTQLTFN